MGRFALPRVSLWGSVPSYMVGSPCFSWRWVSSESVSFGRSLVSPSVLFVSSFREFFAVLLCAGTLLGGVSTLSLAVL